MRASAALKQRPRPSAQIHKRARASVKGLIISWDDPEPWRETHERIAGKIDHRNPIYRTKAVTMFNQFGDWLTREARFRWLVKINVVFDYPNGVTQNEECELEAVATIAELNSHALEQIEAALRCGNRECYRHTEFTIECLGNN